MRGLSAELADGVGMIELTRESRSSSALRRVLCVHAVSGSPLSYRPLAARLRTGFAVTGVRSVGLTPGHAPQDRILTMARSYVAAATVADTGEVLLCGWSMGGLIAFEMAGILVGQGVPVRVAMIDAQFPSPSGRHLDERDLLRWYAEDVADTLGVDRFVEPEGFAEMSTQDRLTWLAGRLEIGGPADGQRWVPELRRRFDTFAANVRAIESYRPVPTPVDVLMVRGGRSPVTSWEWEPMVGGRSHDVVVDGDHYSLVRPPTVDLVADLVAEHFTR